MRPLKRQTWRNHTGNQSIQPLRTYAPQSLDDLVTIVRDAEAAGATVRAVGSGHSWSDAALTTGFVVLPQGLARPLDLEPALLRDPAAAGRLVRVEAGMRIRELNALLDGQNRALSNMGGYDGQTLAGVVSTSTHGSGGQMGPIADQVRSLDVVACRGEVLRIEPATGAITDADAFAARYPRRRLVQDDAWFRAARVGVGCLGLIYAATLEVREEYWLKEVRTRETIEDVLPRIAAGDVLRDNRHFETYFTPYARRDGRHTCIVTTRNETAPGADTRRTRNWLNEAVALFPGTPHILNVVTGAYPPITPFLLERALAALRDADYTNISYKVLNIGAANYLPAYSSEIGVPVGAATDAVRIICDVAERHRRLGSVYQTSPIALRFVRGSDASLSMMQGRDTMMIELIHMTRTEGGFELLAAYEDALYALEGRPHWGQVNTLTEPHVRALYGTSLDEWLSVCGEVNATGVFDSPFSKRVGLSAASTR